MADWIQTYTGKRFHWKNPHPSEVSIIDIAHALSNECRFGGHCLWHYSVAQHSVYVSELVPLELGGVALMHDAAEAYCKDIPRPIKSSLEGYKEIEERILAAIGETFGVDLLNRPPEIHRADMRMLATERRDLMAQRDWPGFEHEPVDKRIAQLTPTDAKRQFLALFRFHFGGEVGEIEGVGV